MRQILQSLRTGEVRVADIPRPLCSPRHLLIRTSRTLVSAGTERMLLEFGQASLLAKAKAQPERILEVKEKILADGLLPTVRSVFAKLDRPLALGYCNAGMVEEVGAEATGFSTGDRVASNGPHSEFVRVPQNLCARIPDKVSDEEAAFVPLAAVALQGIRLANPTLGESVAVIGLGLLGLMTVQILQANGCLVLGSDIDEKRCAMARSFGARTVTGGRGADLVQAAIAFSQGRGMDAAIVTASSTGSEIMQSAARMSRKRGRIVLVGMAKLEFSRRDFYEKELQFHVSCSYGPGRYDPDYETRGQDYPLGYVRWTSQRNFEAALQLLETGRLDVKSLISHRFPITQADSAYELVAERKDALGIILEYCEADGARQQKETGTIRIRSRGANGGAPVVGFLGAGNFSSQVLLPLLSKAGCRLKTIASSTGLGAAHFGQKFGFEGATADDQEVLRDPEVNVLFIATRHDSHAALAVEALRMGKHVFVEKPLCITAEELKIIEEEYARLWGKNRAPLLMVGFNRRFSPHLGKIKSLLDGVSEPKAFVATVNAGPLPEDHWTQDMQSGGGRIVGEGCHFIDMLRFLAGCRITEARALYMQNRRTKDTASLGLRFEDGSVGTVHYLSNGHKSFAKEHLEVFCGGRILRLDNFRDLRGFGWPGFKRMRLWRQDKGHAKEIETFLEAVRSGSPCPIPFQEVHEVTKITLSL